MSNGNTGNARSRSGTYRAIAWTLAVVGVASFVAAVTAYWYKLSAGAISPYSSDWGTFGDFIGGMAGTVIALATLIALSITLQLQARELEETRAELNRQAAALEKQTFEATFFKLLSNRQECLTRFAHGQDAHGPVRGRAALSAIAHAVASAANNAMPGANDLTSAVTVMATVLNPNRHELDPLIGSTLQLLRFVSRAEGTAGGVDYREIAKADFSVADQVLLVCVGLSEYGQRFDAFEVIRASGVVIGLKANAFTTTVPQAMLDKYSPPAVHAGAT